MAELSGREPVSASDPELLSALGWARTSLLKTLETLENAGLVASWSEPAGTGRPRRLFATTEPGSQRRG
jgi:predicted ArsR family transcriptional regulator